MPRALRPILRGTRRPGWRILGSAWRHANLEPRKSGIPGRKAGQVAWHNRPARGTTRPRKVPPKRCHRGWHPAQDAQAEGTAAGMLTSAPTRPDCSCTHSRPLSGSAPRSAGPACFGTLVQPDAWPAVAVPVATGLWNIAAEQDKITGKLPDDADRPARRGTGAGCHGLLARPLAQHRRARGHRRPHRRRRAGRPVSRHPAGSQIELYG
jgi:hypothetical protein